MRPMPSHSIPIHDNNSLLVQFIVSEFIRLYRLHIQFNMLVQENLGLNRPEHTLYPSFIHLLGQLVGSLLARDRSPFSHWSLGPLTKFKEYSEQLSRNSLHQNKLHHHLHILAHQAWLTVVHNLELLHSLDVRSTHTAPPSTLFLTPLQRISYHLSARLGQISKLLPRIASAYWGDESVALFLLRKNDLLKEIYGPDVLYKRFKCPLKKEELISFLADRYKARGFETLPPAIHQLLELGTSDHVSHV